MNTYEGMFLIDSAKAKDAENWNNVTSHVNDILTKNGAEIVKAEKWGERKLAYEISGCKRGAYLLVHFNAPGSTVAPLKRDCQLSETILRTLVVVDEDADVAAASAEETEVHADSAEDKAAGGEIKEGNESLDTDEHQDEEGLAEEITEDKRDVETKAEDVDEGDGADVE